MTILTLPQKLFHEKQLPDKIQVEVCDGQEESDWDAGVQRLLESIESTSEVDHAENPVRPVGIAPLFSTPESYIEYLAFSTAKRALVIKAPADGWGHISHANWEALSNFLAGTANSSTSYVLVGFELAATVLACLREGKLRVHGVDLAAISMELGSLPSAVVEEVLGSTSDRQFEKLWRRLPQLEDGATRDEARERLEVERVAWRAWMSVAVALPRLDVVAAFDQLDTKPREDLKSEHLDVLADLQSQYDQLEASKPEKIISEHTSVTKSGAQLVVKQAAYKNKARRGGAQDVRIVKGGKVLTEGRVIETKGKETTIAVSGANVDLGEDDVETIEIIGRDDLTNAEVARNVFIRELLQGSQSLQTSDFIRKIWFPSQEDKDELNSVKARFATDNHEDAATPSDGASDEKDEDEDPLKDSKLNPSQANVARAMLSPHSFALVHGPPGTGKTRTIAEVVKVWVKSGKTAYLVAQTNVGVKNIAEALIKQEITEFKLLVSNEFYEEWHEKEFEKCIPYMITSKFFAKPKFLKEMRGVKIILCTMNMLFSRTLEKKGVFVKWPLTRLVVDEASQIFVGDYLALFFKFRADLKKVCWFGDPSQLPPHQREQISGLQSIYDIQHVKEASLLLDTQYRMPPEVGNFVSGAMYEQRLKSNPLHEVPGFQCLKFVDVAIGEEKMQNTSWINEGEGDTIVHLVRNYYHDLQFSVITPYDSQRKLIEKKLIAAELPGKGRCYNVDSFQGNEDEYILISCVRTEKPGFLDLHNRINVMLTRCQRGMVIVTHKEFIRTVGRMTLVGRLASTWNSSDEDEESGVWAYYKDVMNKNVDMPSVKGNIKPATKPKPVEAPGISGFYAPTAPAWGVNVGWGSSPPAWPRNPSPPKSAPPPPVRTGPPARTSPSPWGHSMPTVKSSASPPAGAWVAGKPTVKKTSGGPSRTPAPTVLNGWTMSGLPSQTGGQKKRK